MKKYILRYGIFSGTFLVVVAVTIFYAMGGSNAGPDTYGMGEVVGYSSIIVACIFVILGIKKYRDDERGGFISFAESMKIGAIILLFPSIAFAAYNVVYVKWMDPDFTEKYYEYSLEKAKAEAEPEEYEAIEAKMESEKAFFSNLPLGTLMMFLTVYLIGIILTTVSSFFLAKKPSSA